MKSVTPHLFDAFEPDAERLVRLIVSHIDDGMLAEIAAADYGREQEMHLAELRKIRDGCHMVTPLPWHPAEVLELFRWSEPADFEHKPGRYGIEGHWMRAFACAVLLREACKIENEEFRSSWDSTAIQLVESLGVLNCFQQAGSSLLSRLITLFDSDPVEQIALLGYAMLAIAIAPEAQVSDETLLALLEWSNARGTREWVERGGDETEDWLVVSINGCTCKGTWRRVAERLLSDVASRSEKLQASVLSVVSRLAGS